VLDSTAATFSARRGPGETQTLAGGAGPRGFFCTNIRRSKATDVRQRGGLVKGVLESRVLRAGVEWQGDSFGAIDLVVRVGRKFHAGDGVTNGSGKVPTYVAR